MHMQYRKVTHNCGRSALLECTPKNNMPAAVQISIE